MLCGIFLVAKPWQQAVILLHAISDHGQKERLVQHPLQAPLVVLAALAHGGHPMKSEEVGHLLTSLAVTEMPSLLAKQGAQVAVPTANITMQKK